MPKSITSLRSFEEDDAKRRFALRMMRKRVVGLVVVGIALVFLSGCDGRTKWNSLDISGAFPSLAFNMTRASDGKPVTVADYKGQIVLLYFGYTFCPDVCPTTLSNVAAILTRLGPDAKHVRMLFVTVDPNRDTPSVLASYVKNFGPDVEGLRGTPDQLAALARRYRVVYSVTPATKDHPYDVTHSSAIYVFDGSGTVRLLVSSLATSNPDIAGTVADLKRLVEKANPPGLLTRLMDLV
jgi:protein SCO1/2